MTSSDAPAPVSGRLSDPAICSVIFAPSSHNSTLASVTTHVRITEAIAFESLTDPDEFVKRRMFENIRRAAPQVQTIFAEYLRDYLEKWFTTATLKLPSEVALPGLEAVPARSFPFASHFNLLGLPEVEGVFFDPDDFIER